MALVWFVAESRSYCRSHFPHTENAVSSAELWCTKLAHINTLPIPIEMCTGARNFAIQTTLHNEYAKRIYLESFMTLLQDMEMVCSNTAEKVLFARDYLLLQCDTMCIRKTLLRDTICTWLSFGGAFTATFTAIVPLLIFFLLLHIHHVGDSMAFLLLYFPYLRLDLFFDGVFLLFFLTSPAYINQFSSACCNHCALLLFRFGNFVCESREAG